MSGAVGMNFWSEFKSRLSVCELVDLLCVVMLTSGEYIKTIIVNL